MKNLIDDLFQYGKLNREQAVFLLENKKTALSVLKIAKEIKYPHVTFKDYIRLVQSFVPWDWEDEDKALEFTRYILQKNNLLVKYEELKRLDEHTKLMIMYDVAINYRLNSKK